jgi:predicted nucleotidyltransferase
VSIPTTILERIQRFNRDLADMTPSAVVQRHITQGECYALDGEQHIKLRMEVAGHFKVNPNQIVVVGSSKLGFSIAPRKRYRPFHDGSDIDVAVVSPALFDNIWRQAFDYRMDTGVIWEGGSDFADYLFRGWIRPDMLPTGGRFPSRDDWFDFFRRLSGSGSYGRYQVKGGLYREWHHLERYQALSVVKCQQELGEAHEDDLVG